MKKFFIVLMVISGSVFVSCDVKNAWLEMTSIFATYPALKTFEARDADYFPEFIDATFKNTRAFESRFPKLAAAREGIKLIEVKRLNRSTQKVNEVNLNWSADGSVLGYEVVTKAHRKILVRDLVQNITKELLIMKRKKSDDFLAGLVGGSTISYNAGLRWAQNANEFVFMSNGGRGTYDVYHGYIGGKERAIASSSKKDGYASWNPTSREVAFVSGRTGKGDIYLVDVDTNVTSRLSHSPQVDLFPEWSKNGNKIFYASGDSTNHDIFYVSRNKGGDGWSRPQRLTNTPFDELRPTVSPDGNLLAFYGAEYTNDGRIIWNIYVVDSLSSDVLTNYDLRSRKVAANVVVDINTGPAWSPDSRKIFYVAQDEKNFNPICGYDLYSGESYLFETGTRMNRDIMISSLGIMSFRAQDEVWDRVYIALTNQGAQIQGESRRTGKAGISRMLGHEKLSSDQRVKYL